MIKHVAGIVIGRILQGLSCGYFAVVCPIFINEIVPTELSAYISVLTMFQTTLGMMMAFLLGLSVPKATDSDFKDTQTWRVIFGIPMIFSVAQVILLFFPFNQDSPKFAFRSKKPETVFL